MTTNKPELIICRGLQASGKSTWANAWVSQARAHRVRVNRDLLRTMIDNDVFVKGVTEERILAARDVLVRGLMMRGLSVVVDDTNLQSRHIRKLAKMAYEAAWDWRVQDFTDVPLEVCITRDRDRYQYRGEKFVGETVIRDTYNRFLKGKELPLPVPSLESLAATVAPSSVELYIPDPSLPEAVIVDIDGTVALKGTRSPFDETRVHEDAPNESVIENVRMEKAAGREIIFCSGRTGACYDATTEWLEKHVINDFLIYMRSIGDRRPDNEMKLELFNVYIRPYYNVRKVYDDRNQVVAMWRSLGLPVFQVAEGNF